MSPAPRPPAGADPRPPAHADPRPPARARLLAAGFGPGGPRTMYGLGVIAAAKAAALVAMAGAVAAGVVGVIHGSPAWHAALAWGLIAALARGLLAWAGRVASARAALGAKEALRAQLAERLVESGTASAGSATALATRGLDELDEYYGSVLPALTNAAVIPLLVGVRILFADWISALVIVLTIPLVPLFMTLVGMYTKDTVRDATRALGRLSDHLVELARGLPVLVGLGRVEEQSAALARVSDDYRETTMRALRIAFLSALVLELISTMSVAVVAVFIGLRLVNGSLPLETGLLVLVLAPECFAPFRQLGSAFHASQNGVAALDTASAIIDAPAPRPLIEQEPAVETDAADGTSGTGGTGGTDAADRTAGTNGHAGTNGADRRIGTPAAPGTDGRAGTPGAPEAARVEHLTVRYPGRAEPAVEDLGFVLFARTTTALSGVSGAGKSSVLAVLAGRLSDGTDGARVSGRVRGVDPARIAWVPQHPATVGESVRDELRIYGEGIPRDLLEARIDELAVRFGLAQVLGDDPAQVSPGELRRLAFTRALLRLDAGAELLLLDEPTAHLDPANASAVQAEIERLRGRVTIVLATHDPELIRTADRIVPVGAEAPETAGRRGPGALRAGGSTTRRTGPTTDAEPGTLDALRLLAVFLRPARWRYLGAVLLGAGAALFSASLTAVSGWLIVRAGQEPNIMLLMVAIVGVRFFGIGRAVLAYGQQLVTHDAVFSSIGVLRMRLWRALAERGPASRRLLTGGNSIDHLVLNADRIRDLAPRVVLPIGSGALTAAASIVAVAMLHAPAAPLLVACLAVCLFLAPRLALASDRRAGREQAAIRSVVGRRFVALIQSAGDLRANGVDTAVRSELAELDRSAGVRARRGAWALGAGQALVVAACCATAVGMLPVVLPSVAAGTLPPEVVAVLVLLPLGLIEPLLQVVEAVQQWPTLAASLASARTLEAGDSAARRSPRRIRPASRDEDPAGEAARRSRSHPRGAQREGTPAGVDPDGGAGRAAARLTAAERVDKPAEGERLGSGTLPRIETLCLRDLGARWPGAVEPVFTGLDAEVHAGEWLVVRGPSGSGKSTLLTLLLGYLDADSGAYLLNGSDSARLDPAALRRHLAWAPQEGHLFDSTIRGNLLLARSHEDPPSDRELTSVLERVGLGTLLASLPDGLETRIGPAGSRFSGGQRQRLAVARTLLTRTDVILLDEPTAHLDGEAAAALIADLRAATRDRIAILVTHRDDELLRGDRVIDLGERDRSRAARTFEPGDPPGTGALRRSAA